MTSLLCKIFYRKNQGFWDTAWPCLFLAGVVFAVYSNVYHNAFLFDDENTVVDNQFLRGWRYLPSIFSSSLTTGSLTFGDYYRPLQGGLYLFVFQAIGLKAWGFHLLNVLLHAANACLVYRLGRKLAFRPAGAFLAAAIWAAHPINVEAVAYISDTGDGLYAFFCLGAANALLPDFSRSRIIAASFLFIFALLSKESAIAFPFLAGTLVYFSDKQRFETRRYFRLWPFAAIACVYLLFRMTIGAKIVAANTMQPDGFLDLDFFAAIPVYLRLFLWPEPLFMKHVLEATGGLWAAQAAFGVFAVGGLAAIVFRPQSLLTLPLSWGSLWFFFALSPVLSMGRVAYEHWMYLPMTGLTLGLLEGIAITVNKRFTKTVFLFGLFVLSLFGSMAWQQNKSWRDPITFCNNVFASGRPAPEAHILLGTHYARGGNYDAARNQFELAERDLALSSDRHSIDNRDVLHVNLAALLRTMPGNEHHRDEALRHLEIAIKLNPLSYPALVQLAEEYKQRGDAAHAKVYEDTAAALRRKAGLPSEIKLQDR